MKVRQEFANTFPVLKEIVELEIPKHRSRSLTMRALLKHGAFVREEFEKALSPGKPPGVEPKQLMGGLLKVGPGQRHHYGLTNSFSPRAQTVWISKQLLGLSVLNLADSASVDVKQKFQDAHKDLRDLIVSTLLHELVHYSYYVSQAVESGEKGWDFERDAKIGGRIAPILVELRDLWLYRIALSSP